MSKVSALRKVIYIVFMAVLFFIFIPKMQATDKVSAKMVYNVSSYDQLYNVLKNEIQNSTDTEFEICIEGNSIIAAPQLWGKDTGTTSDDIDAALVIPRSQGGRNKDVRTTVKIYSRKGSTPEITNDASKLTGRTNIKGLATADSGQGAGLPIIFVQSGVDLILGNSVDIIGYDKMFPISVDGGGSLELAGSYCGKIETNINNGKIGDNCIWGESGSKITIASPNDASNVPKITSGGGVSAIGSFGTVVLNGGKLGGGAHGVFIPYGSLTVKGNTYISGKESGVKIGWEDLKGLGGAIFTYYGGTITSSSGNDIVINELNNGKDVCTINAPFAGTIYLAPFGIDDTTPEGKKIAENYVKVSYGHYITCNDISYLKDATVKTYGNDYDGRLIIKTSNQGNDYNYRFSPGTSDPEYVLKYNATSWHDFGGGYVERGVTEYTVTLEKGTGIDSVKGAGSYEAGTSVSISARLLDGYSWSGWTGESTVSTNAYSFTMPSKNVTYKANATANKYKNTLNYNANGGTGAPSADEQPVTYPNTKYTHTVSSTKPTRAGYTFDGWYTAASGGSPVGSTYTVGSDSVAGDQSATIYAHWTSKDLKNTLYYDANGGTGAPSADEQLVTYPNTKYTHTVSSTKPTRTGYTFDGWYTAASGGTKVGSTYTVGSDNATSNQSATIYAHWTPNGLNNILKYDTNGGTNGPSDDIQPVTYPNTKYTHTVSSTKPTRAGYTFDGWYTEASGGTKVGSTLEVGSESVAGDQSATIYAHWTSKDLKNTLYYDANGGTGAPSADEQPVTYPNTKYTHTVSSTKPTRAGYTFDGWYTAASGGSPVGATYTVGSDNATSNQSATIYAHWTANKYKNTLNYNANGGTGKNVF